MASEFIYQSVREALTHGQQESFPVALIAGRILAGRARVGWIRTVIFALIASYAAQPLSLIGHGRLSDGHYVLLKLALALVIAGVLMRMLPKRDKDTTAARRTAKVEARAQRQAEQTNAPASEALNSPDAQQASPAPYRALTFEETAPRYAPSYEDAMADLL